MLNSIDHRSRNLILCQTMVLGLTTLLGSLIGCGEPVNKPTAVRSTISWEEFQKMDEEQQRDPYVLDYLDESAKKNLDQANKKRK